MVQCELCRKNKDEYISLGISNKSGTSIKVKYICEDCSLYIHDKVIKKGGRNSSQP